MDFEDILKEWDTTKKTKSAKVSKKKKKNDNLSMDSILDMYPPEDKVENYDPRPVPSRIKRRNYRRMKHQITLDLHGFNVVSAKVELEDFIKRCKRKGLEKVLIIHGKGLHSDNGDSVLRTTVKNYLMECSFIGEIGHPSEKEGGCGATWAIIKLNAL